MIAILCLETDKWTFLGNTLGVIGKCLNVNCQFKHIFPTSPAPPPLIPTPTPPPPPAKWAHQGWSTLVLPLNRPLLRLVSLHSLHQPLPRITGERCHPPREGKWSSWRHFGSNNLFSANSLSWFNHAWPVVAKLLQLLAMCALRSSAPGSRHLEKVMLSL